MATSLPDYNESVRRAAEAFWNVRTAQSEKSKSQGVINPGDRSEVTGGQHLNGFQELVVSVFIESGIPARLIDVKRRPIAGYFRRNKSWDLVVMVEGRVLAIIEFKSMSGKNPGQNFNNRTDEALGQAHDVWKAVEREIITGRPWLGYFMVLEDTDRFHHPVRAEKTVWDADSVFDGASYADRYVIFFERMIRERLLDAACLLMGNRKSGNVAFPSQNLSFDTLAAGIRGRCLQFMAMNPDIDFD